VPAHKSGLGTGLYFSGGAVAMSLFGTVTQRLGTVPPGLGLSVAAIGFGLAGGCLALSASAASAAKS
ncbi:MAG: MFS transporter, partial [Cyanobacteria bacterium J06627_15]